MENYDYLEQVTEDVKEAILENMEYWNFDDREELEEVAHDELWNLHPTTRSINSSKSNLLPAWNLYFDGLGQIEYMAYKLKSENEIVAKEFNKIAPYHLNNQEIRNQLYVEGLSESDFKVRLEHVIRPVYESAKNCGFREWIYSEENCVQQAGQR